MRDSMRAFGFAEAEISRVIDEQSQHIDALGIWPENMDAVVVFTALGTQWRVIVGMGGMVWQGIDYQAIAPVCAMLETAADAELFNSLRILESSAKQVLNG